MGPDSPQPQPQPPERQPYQHETTLKNKLGTAIAHRFGAQILSLQIKGHNILKARTKLKALALDSTTGEIDTSSPKDGGGSFPTMPHGRYRNPWRESDPDFIDNGTAPLQMIHGPFSTGLNWTTTEQTPTSVTMETSDSKNAQRLFGNDLFTLKRNVSLTDKEAIITNTVRYDGQRTLSIEPEGERRTQDINLQFGEHPYFTASANACFVRKDGSFSSATDLLEQTGNSRDHFKLDDLLANDDEIWYMPDGPEGYVIKIKISSFQNGNNITSQTEIALWKHPESSGYLCIEPIVSMPNVTDLNPGDTFSETMTISTADSLEELQTAA